MAEDPRETPREQPTPPEDKGQESYRGRLGSIQGEPMQADPISMDQVPSIMDALAEPAPPPSEPPSE